MQGLRPTNYRVSTLERDFGKLPSFLREGRLFERLPVCLVSSIRAPARVSLIR